MFAGVIEDDGRVRSRRWPIRMCSVCSNRTRAPSAAYDNRGCNPLSKKTAFARPACCNRGYNREGGMVRETPNKIAFAPSAPGP